MSEEKVAPPPEQPAAPQQGYPPQDPQQGGYPPQAPQQGGYPPQQGGYPPQQGGYPPQGPPPGGFPAQAPPPAYDGKQPQPQVQPVPAAGQTVVINTIQVQATVRDRPVNLQCPNCQNNVTSNVIYENGVLVWLSIFVLAVVFQLWLGCCLIPLCIDSLKDARHICPVCNYQLGLYKRI